MEKKEGLKHCQEIITKVDAENQLQELEIKSLKNEQFNLYEELKGMEEVLLPLQQKVSLYAK